MSPEMHQIKRWVIEPADEQKVKDLALSVGIAYLPALTLYKRGYRDAESVKRFLNPSLEHLYDPFGLPDMEVAVKRLLEAKERGEKILVHGDYDVDGVSATALLVRGFKRLGIQTEYYLPHRLKEGYGVSDKVVDVTRSHGAGLVITVDCGITAIDEAKKIREAGLDFIVTDHHEPAEALPKALAVVDPKRLDSSYPFSELAGVGIAYKLLSALHVTLGRSMDELNEDLDLAALGTIADVVRLVDENRVFAYYGLRSIAETEKVGLKALMGMSRIEDKSITASGVAFGLAPRLNASGRMSDALYALRLLLTDDPVEAQTLSEKLDQHNRNRRLVEDAIAEQARIIAEHQIKESNPRILVAYDPSWHEGVIGIVASRLVDAYYRPSFLFAEKDGRLKGSARSIPGFHLYNGLAAVKKHLISFGGHEAAAGVVMEKSELRTFTEAINEYAMQSAADIFEPRLYLDAEIEPGDIGPETVETFNRFRPFGMGNPEPCFASIGLEVVGVPRVVGRKHLKFVVRKDETTFPVVAFGKANYILKLEPGRKNAIDLAFRMGESSYWGRSSIEFIMKDIKFHSQSEDKVV